MGFSESIYHLPIITGSTHDVNSNDVQNYVQSLFDQYLMYVSLSNVNTT